MANGRIHLRVLARIRASKHKMWQEKNDAWIRGWMNGWTHACMSGRMHGREEHGRRPPLRAPPGMGALKFFTRNKSECSESSGLLQEDHRARRPAGPARWPPSHTALSRVDSVVATPGVWGQRRRLEVQQAPRPARRPRASRAPPSGEPGSRP